MTKLTHLIELLITLQYKNLTTASELAEILNVNKKTVYRYIETLIEANIPVMTRKGRYGGFYLDHSFYMKQPELEKSELEALIMAADILSETEEFVFKKHLRNAVSKLKTTAIHDNNELIDMSEIKNFKVDNIGVVENVDSIISKINLAIAKSRSLEVVYYSISKNASSKLKLSPYAITYRCGDWHVIAYNSSKGYIGSFAISRIKKLKVTEDIFFKPTDFSVSEHIDRNWESINEGKKRIVIKFSSNLNEFIKDVKWHPNQNIYSENDGSIIFEVFLEDLSDIKRWVMGFGLDAEVLEPKALRDEILDDVRFLFKTYEKII